MYKYDKVKTLQGKINEIFGWPNGVDGGVEIDVCGDEIVVSSFYPEKVLVASNYILKLSWEHRIGLDYKDSDFSGELKAIFLGWQHNLN